MTIETELPAVKVKPLIWESYNIDMHKAETFFGYYVVAASGHCWLNSGPIALPFESIAKDVEMAKGFCRADYERRIISALTLKDDPGNVAETRAAALEEAASHVEGMFDNDGFPLLNRHRIADGIRALIRDRKPSDDLKEAEGVVE